MNTGENAAAQAFLAHYSFVRTVANRAAPWPGLTDDIAQQVFLEFIRKAGRWDLSKDLRPLLATMTRMVALRHWREAMRKESPSVEPGLLKKGEAIRLERDGRSRRMAADPGVFQLSGEVRRLSTDENLRRSVMWMEVMNGVNADPALLARFSMRKDDGGSSFSLTNTASRKEVAAGAIIGCTRGEGRWPDLSALQFGCLSDRVRVDIPGEFEALTFTAG